MRKKIPKISKKKMFIMIMKNIKDLVFKTIIIMQDKN